MEPQSTHMLVFFLLHQNKPKNDFRYIIWNNQPLAKYTFACSIPGSAAHPFSPFWFTVEPQDTLAVRGNPALLNCSAHSDGAMPARIKWKKDGTFMSLVSDERRRILPDGSLFFTHITHSKHNKPDEGIYQCVATIDNLGSISSRTARLSVAGTPRFSSQPSATTVHVGDSQLMACDINSDLVQFTHWEKDRRPLEPNAQMIQLPSGALVISNASEADAGLYRCVVENVGPAKASEEAQLQTVPDERKLEFLVQPAPVTKVMGSSVLLPCAAAGYPVPHIHWMVGDKPLEESEGRIKVVGGGSLQIADLVEDDAGVYTCVAENSNSTATSQAELTVQVPPKFITRPANTYAHESMDIVFECDVSGSPAPTVKWVKNGDAVIPSDYFKIIKEHNLQVLGLVKSDEGFYQCLAENDAGNIQSSAQLIILNHASPTPSAPRDVVASLVSTRFIKLTWRPPVEPHGDLLTYSVFYSQDGTSRERVVNTSRPGDMQVTIQNLLPDTRYRFRVVAHNSNGQGESSAVLKVPTQAEVQVPGPAPNLQAVSNTPTSVSLSWDKPLTGNGDILSYKLYYTDRTIGNEQDVDVDGQAYTMTGLKKNTEYSFRVVANNKHGSGVSTEDVIVRTLSDSPSAPPQNLTLEVQNSKSIMLRWQPPPPSGQNGEIISYKIRYRKGSRKSESAVITAGTELYKLIEGLDPGTEYSFRVSAMTVNGTGPNTEWTTAETFESDLDESRVPDQPSSLHVRPLVNSIVVSWTPPENQDIVVRGYTIDYGIGSPHSQTIKVDYKQRYYTIENLNPSSQYVITLKAFNNVGEGIPVYESTATRAQSDPDVDLYELFPAPYTPVPDHTPMMPPVGVQASVLTHDTIKVTWADNTLPKNQKITDNRFYTVRWKTNIPANTKVKMANTSSLSHIVTGLKPNTLYEFSVMLTKGRRASTWSMTAQGTTFESIPSSPPKDVTVVSKENKPRTIIVNWQPPSEANGKITGYIIYYSTDVNAEVHDWVIEPVVGNRLTHQIQELTLDTTYYFKIQARNSKGMGPMSDAVLFRTPKSNLHHRGGGRGSFPVHSSHHIPPEEVRHSPNRVFAACFKLNVTQPQVEVNSLLTHWLRAPCRKRAASKSTNGSHKYKGNSKDLKPPDLWIHHERLELKPMDKSPDPNPVMTETPIPRTSQDITPADSSIESNPHLQQRRNSYRGHESEDSMSTLAGRRGMRPKMMMPFDAQPPQQSVRNTPSTEPLPPATASSQVSCPSEILADPEGSYHGSSTTDEEPSYSSNLPPHRSAHPHAHAHPLKSFAVPAIPVSSHPSYESPALPSTPLLAQTGPPTHPHVVKTASIGTLGRTRTPMIVTVPNAPPEVPETSKMLEDVDSSYEPDELTEEMAHLEGLMKDLNAITTAP
uniref:Neogenin 1b n=1 Tax=Oryzias latipes TaxID=8090 RepID=A0A3P9JUI5_ORYLA